MVTLNGLTPDESYWLSINAISLDSPENDILGRLKIPGWLPGAFHGSEGYWDLKEIKIDSQGRYAEQLILPLPPLTYGVKFFVKKRPGGSIVLHRDALLFTVDRRWTVWERVRFVLVVLAVLTCVIGIGILRFSARGRRSIMASVAWLRQTVTAVFRKRAVIPASRVDPPPPSPLDRPRPNTFVRKGHFWTIIYAGQDIQLKHSKGLSCIAYLLQQPGEPILALDLLHLIDGGESVQGRTQHLPEPDLHISNLRDRNPIVDRQARAAYRDQLVTLQRDLDEAQRNIDRERAAQLQQQIEAFEEQLLAAIHGESGKGKAPIERARVAITKNILRAEANIREHHPALGRYLDRSIHTGLFCIYTPDPDNPILWEL
jgi:hypothetical protein